MKLKHIINIIKFIFFLTYVILIFFVKSNIALIGALAIDIILIIAYKINLKSLIDNLIKISIFVLITAIINAFVVNINYAILIGIKLILVCVMTYIFSKMLSYMEFATVIEDLAHPLKLFGINPKDLGLLVTIAISFIPILREELERIKYVLLVKGFKVNTINIIKNMNIVFKPLFVSIMERINEIEYSLRAKGYQ